MEHPAFKKFVNFLQPIFGTPSRTTAARDVFKQFEIEKENLKTFLYLDLVQVNRFHSYIYIFD